MKTISLDQPYATFVALGVKTVETRSWAPRFRGRLAIHATARRPPLTHLPPLSRGRQPIGPTWLVIDTITDPAYQGPRPVNPKTGHTSHIPNRATTPTLFYPGSGPHGRPWDDKAGTSAIEQGTAVYLPLGAVIATCTLVDCLPIHEWCCQCDHRPGRYLLVSPTSMGSEMIVGMFEAPGGHGTDHPDWPPSRLDCLDPAHPRQQAPYGDYRCGRWGWLIAEIEPLQAPVPARGHQQLWNWTP